jgi:hypothetical protein
MAFNEPAAYGRDIRCVRDADALFSTVEGVDVVYQDAIHRITTDNVLGDDGSGGMVIEGWGFDCRRLLGLTSARVKAHQPIIAQALLRDPRIDSADVVLTLTRTNGLEDVELRARCVTAEGAFEIVIKSIHALLASDLVGQR